MIGMHVTTHILISTINRWQLENNERFMRNSYTIIESLGNIMLGRSLNDAGLDMNFGKKKMLVMLIFRTIGKPLVLFLHY